MFLIWLEPDRPVAPRQARRRVLVSATRRGSAQYWVLLRGVFLEAMYSSKVSDPVVVFAHVAGCSLVQKHWGRTWPVPGWCLERWPLCQPRGQFPGLRTHLRSRSRSSGGRESESRGRAAPGADGVRPSYSKARQGPESVVAVEADHASCDAVDVEDGRDTCGFSLFFSCR